MTLPLPDGRRIGFTGMIDRVDEMPDGRLVVTDHKTGSPRGLEKLSSDDPTLGASHFQLPVYAARRAPCWIGPRRPSRPGTRSSARSSGASRWRSTTSVWASVTAGLAAVVAGIEAGVFPARPAQPTFQPWVSCWFCEPDGLGTAGRWDEWERKRHAPELSPWFGEPDGGDDG